MSRGLGRRERGLLAEIEEEEVVPVTWPSMTPAEQAARRRAAYSLERKGLALLRMLPGEGGERRRLCLMPADVLAPVQRKVQGRDGRMYRGEFGRIEYGCRRPPTYGCKPPLEWSRAVSVDRSAASTSR